MGREEVGWGYLIASTSGNWMAFRMSGTWKVVRAFFRREEAGGSLRLYFCALADVVAAFRRRV